MNRKMRAAVVHEFGRPLRIEEVDVPEVRPGRIFGGREKGESMIGRTALTLVIALVCAGSGPTSAEIRPWDRERVAALAKQLREATVELYDAFYKQPVLGVAQNKNYYRLKQDIRSLRQESGHLSEALARGDGLDETRPIWEDLMQTVRRATDHAASVFTTQDVTQKADAARAILDQLTPYYESDAAADQPGRER